MEQVVQDHVSHALIHIKKQIERLTLIQQATRETVSS